MNNIFSLEKHGLETPVRLVKVSKDQEIVRFPLGLRGNAHFSEAYLHFQKIFEEQGILIMDPFFEKSSFLKGKEVVKLQDPEFGQVFYQIHFPHLFKHNLSDYQWQKL